MHFKLHRWPTFHTTTGFLSFENCTRCDGSFFDSLPYRNASEGSTVPQYSLDIPIKFLYSCKGILQTKTSCSGQPHACLIFITRNDYNPKKLSSKLFCNSSPDIRQGGKQPPVFPSLRRRTFTS